MSNEDLQYKQRVQVLEQNLAQISTMYHNSVTEKSVLKVDVQVIERKLTRREEKILALEKAVFSAKNENK